MGLRRLERCIDGALSAVGPPRWAVRRTLAPTVGNQASWGPSIVLAHKAPQLLPLVARGRCAAVLYANNHLLRSHGKAEANRVVGAAEAIICVSDSLANRTSGRLSRGLRNQLGPQRVDALASNESGPLSRDGQLKVLFIGHVIPEKGVDGLVGAVRRLDRVDIRIAQAGESYAATHDWAWASGNLYEVLRNARQ